MKYLQEYREEAQTNLFKKYGCFFAFSKEQFNEGLNKVKQNSLLLEGEKLTEMGGGMYAPSKNAITVINELDCINTNAMELDLKENGKVKIIIRELYNYESFYTGDIADALQSLKPYGFTSEEIGKIYGEEYPNYEKYNC